MIDFSVYEGNSVTVSDLDFVLQQIDVLFDTSPRELLGDVKYGTDYERYLYDLKISNEGLKSKVMSDLNSLDLRGYKVDVEVYLLQGSERDIVLIDIQLSNDYESYQKTYNIS